MASEEAMGESPGERSEDGGHPDTAVGFRGRVCTVLYCLCVAVVSVCAFFPMALGLSVRLSVQYVFHFVSWYIQFTSVCIFEFLGLSCLCQFALQAAVYFLYCLLTVPSLHVHFS